MTVADLVAFTEQGSHQPAVAKPAA